MASGILKAAAAVAAGYAAQNYGSREWKIIYRELCELTGTDFEFVNVSANEPSSAYEDIQTLLSNLNEKEPIRRRRGVYYTPGDIVRFILLNSIKLDFGGLRPDNLHEMDIAGIEHRTFCFDKTVYDPTCGTGVFLLAALELKLEMLEFHQEKVTKRQIQKAVSSVMGNDSNRDSISITKIRLFLCVLRRFGAEKVKGLASVLNDCFTSYDFVATQPGKERYDVIVGNPPYVEDVKSESVPPQKYGNIYANVLEHAAMHLKENGVLGFVIPLSYVATPRMKKIREELYRSVPEQYILSYSDRPDCLFASVHQKLCVLFGRKGKTEKQIYTGNYRYWYREERQMIFDTARAVRNRFATEEYIPKLGTDLDVSIYSKLTSGYMEKRESLLQIFQKEGTPVYLNMRAAFWMKAFLREHSGAEYKRFCCRNKNEAHLAMCLLNSSLFWWYWICVSDCWHITRKELSGFKVPEVRDYTEIIRLAEHLEERLEETKVFVGTRQTEYEYKHKDCAEEIHQLDDYINELYGLTDEESAYIKNFAWKYRAGGGVSDGCN